MPFPWRDFAWFTLLIGLAIGLATEQQRFREFTALRAQAAASEKEAREFGDLIAKRTNTQTQFKEFSDVAFQSQDGRYLIGAGLDIPHVWKTDERDSSWITGMEDLDFMLLMIFILAPLGVVLGILIRKATPSGGKAYAKFSLYTYRVVVPINLLFFTSLLIAGYCGKKPFSATLGLAFVVFTIASFIRNPVTLTPELSKLIDEKYEDAIDFSAWRFLTQWPLRDFFWITVLIGLSVGILSEHKRARALSHQAGRAEWWSNAVQAMRHKHQQEMRKVSEPATADAAREP